MTKVRHIFLVLFSTSIMFVPAAHSQSLKAQDAQVKDNFIVVKSLETPLEGCLVAHKGGGGQPGQIVGFVMIKSGSNTEVRIPVSATLDHGPNAVIVLMMHEDAGTNDGEVAIAARLADQPPGSNGRDEKGQDQRQHTHA